MSCDAMHRCDRMPVAAFIGMTTVDDNMEWFLELDFDEYVGSDELTHVAHSVRMAMVEYCPWCGRDLRKAD